MDASLTNLILDETGSEVDAAHLSQAIGLTNGARSLAVAIYPRLLQFRPSKGMTDCTNRHPELLWLLQPDHTTPILRC